MPRLKPYDGEHCPKCGDTVRIVGEGLMVASTTGVYQEVACNNVGCGARFNEVYRMVLLEEVDEDGKVLEAYPIKK